MTSHIINGQRVKVPAPVTTVIGEVVTIHTPGVYGLDDTSLVKREGGPVYRAHGLRAAVYCPDGHKHRNPAKRVIWEALDVPAHLTDHGSIIGWLVVGIES